jgi:putative sterol carrier protein
MGALLYPSADWLRSWADLANRTEAFKSSGAGWSGALALVIEPEPDAGVAAPMYLRLEGAGGTWERVAYGLDAALADGCEVTLLAPYRRWKQVIRQDLDPVKGVLQGKLRLVGHLPTVLEWIRAFAVLAELAGRLETVFVDEVAPEDRAD